MLDDILDKPQFSLNSSQKKSIFEDELGDLHAYHSLHCEYYDKYSKTYFNYGKNHSVDKFPFLPVGVFKNYSLKSIQDNEVYKVLSSSGTTGSVPSRIFLDTATAKLQTKALSRIFSHILGIERLPMLIIDSKSMIKAGSHTARSAGILGLSIFGKDHTYALDDNFNFDKQVFVDFIKRHQGEKILIFGFTFLVWSYLYQNGEIDDLDLSKAILIHSGGWKKLAEIAVDNDTFRKSLKDRFNLTNIYNFYGMAEQVGSVFLENEKGYLHCPNFSDVIIRNPVDFSIQKNGEPGLIQVLSLLPKSYPGHSILTEDIGVVMGEDDCNGWNGKYFKILGRAKKAELRGCSDTMK